MALFRMQPGVLATRTGRARPRLCVRQERWRSYRRKRGWLRFRPQARVDHAYNAFGKTAATAKAIIDLYYGKMPDKSYLPGVLGEDDKG